MKKEISLALFICALIVLCLILYPNKKMPKMDLERKGEIYNAPIFPKEEKFEEEDYDINLDVERFAYTEEGEEYIKYLKEKEKYGYYGEG